MTSSRKTMGDTAVTLPRQGMEADESMCCYVFDVIQAQLSGKKLPKVPDTIPDTDECALFVTWKKRSRDGRKYQLRGCIGTLSPIPLHEGLRTYAITSAFRDRRFQPITRSELKDLQVCVSLLIDFEVAQNGVYDWTIGVHGLIIEFRADGQSFSATYLPEVCAEQGWSKTDCILSLIRKAGYSGHISDELMAAVQVTRYQSSKYSMYYEEYVRTVERN